MAARKSSRVNREYKTKYRVRNWREYERGLRSRGDVTIVDSTGLKILGSGEWNVHRYKASRKRREWRKLHIGVDDEGFIVAAELTASSEGDASTLPDLLAQVEVPIQRFHGRRGL